EQKVLRLLLLSSTSRRRPSFPLFPYTTLFRSIESGKSLIIKFLTISEAHPDGTRTLFFELNGQPREVNIRDRSLRVVERAHPKRSEEHTSELQSRFDLVCRLLLEKKKSNEYIQ